MTLKPDTKPDDKAFHVPFKFPYFLIQFNSIQIIGSYYICNVRSFPEKINSNNK